MSIISCAVYIRCLRLHLNHASWTVHARFYSDDEREKKSNKQKSEKKPQEKPQSNRLNELLSSMSTSEKVALVKNVQPPMPGARSLKAKANREAKENLEKSKPGEIFAAAKQVAEIMGGDQKRTESELLSKLLRYADLSGTERSTDNLSNVILGMKIDQERKPGGSTKVYQTKSQFVRRMIHENNSEQRKYTDEFKTRDRRTRQQPLAPRLSGQSVDLFGAEPLGIFKNVDELKNSVDMLSTWSHLEDRELRLAVTHPPMNYFQKIALQTEQGIIWKFPIDNEQGLDEEAKVYFADHIFLEQYLETWCPTKGPIRHFMELVCVGLSKNPYITAKEKQDHILWFRDFFEEKKELLKEIIIQDSESPLKQIEK